MADKFAEAGFLCVVPNIMGKHAVDPAKVAFKPEDEVAQMPWYSRAYESLRKVKLIPTIVQLIYLLPVQKTIEDMHTVFAAIREKFGIEKIGVSGYCWGGKHAIMMAEDQKQIQAVVGIHTSRTEIPQEIEKINVPVLFLCAEHDPYIKQPQRDTIINVLKERKEKGNGPDYDLVLYEKTEHGFAMRGDRSKPAIKFAMDDHLKRSIEFYKKYLQ